jgi:hypothetical protein
MLKSSNNVVPFVSLSDYFSEIKTTNMGVIRGNCKICKANDIAIFEHPCWVAIREESKKIFAKLQQEAGDEG